MLWGFKLNDFLLQNRALISYMSTETPRLAACLSGILGDTSE